MTLTGLPHIFDVDTLKSLGTTNLVNGTITPELPVGSIGYDKYGARYRFVKNGGTLLVVGNLLQTPAYDTNQVDLTVAAAAIGASQISITVGATVTANQYAGGKIVVSTTPGLGQTFTIKSHPAVTSAAVGIFQIEELVTVALTTSSKVDICPPSYSGVIQSPTTLTGKSVGTAIFAIPANDYGWIGVEGEFAMLCDATVPTSIGNGVSPSTTTAGAVTKAVTLIDSIGVFASLGVSAKARVVSLRLP